MSEAETALLPTPGARVRDIPARFTAATASARPWMVIAGVTAVGAGLPFVVALAALHQPRWYPVLDMAQIELRVRDVGTKNPPLIGLAGRIHGLNHHGSHPGPIGFWLLWPLYKLFGTSAWALQAAAATLNVVAVAVSLWIAQRRGGTSAVLGVAVALMLLIRAYGFDELTTPWNPYLPMLWWPVFLLAVWSVLRGDVPLLPVAAFAGSLCAQTHVPYVPLVAGVGALAVLVLAVRSIRGGIPGGWRRAAPWAGASVGLLVVLWLPPVIEQMTRSPGNLAVIRDAFTHPTDRPVGVGSEALRTWLGYLDAWGLLEPYPSAGLVGNAVPGLGVATLVVWLGAVAVAWRMRRWDLLDLHLVVAAALVLGFVSITRIFGPIWFWLALWSRGTTMLLVVATVWTAAVALRHTSWATPERARAALAGAAVATAALLTYDATDTRLPPSEARDSVVLAHIAPATARALRTGDVPGGGVDGRYLVLFDEDPFDLGATGEGLVLELEREGFDVGVTERFGPDMVPHRVLRPDEATAAIHQVVGTAAVARWRAMPGAVEVAFHEPRSAEQLARYNRDYRKVVQEMERIGRDDLVGRLAVGLTALVFDESVPQDIRDEVAVLVEYDQPTAVFVSPP